jgi:hypothetical protein
LAYKDLTGLKFVIEMSGRSVAKAPLLKYLKRIIFFMKNVIQYELPDGTPISIETEEADQGSQRVSRGKEGKEGFVQADKRFSDAMAHIKPTAEYVLQAFRDMQTPDEITLDFGIKFRADAGVVFASASSQATFQVTLKWSNEKPTTQVIQSDVTPTETVTTP